MNCFSNLWRRLRSPGQDRAARWEIDEELRFHIDRRTAENVAAGMTPEAAAREARRRFGNIQSVREECRETLGSDFAGTTARDIRFGLRMLWKNPGFAIITVLTLALGIGSTSSVFSLVQGVLLTPPPYPKPKAVVLIQPQRMDGQPYASACTASQWLELRKATNSFEAIAGYEWGFQFLISGDGSESVQGIFVTPDYFKVIGVKPILGREFTQADTAAHGGEETAIILGWNLWQRRFKGDPDIIGKVIHLSRRQPLTVVAVMPPGVRFLPSAGNATEPNYDVDAPVDFWMPLWPPDATQPEQGYCKMAGRLRDGVSLKQAQAELAAIAARQARENPRLVGITARVEPLIAELNRAGKRLLLPLFGAVALVFLIACANVTGLLLARGLQRQQEYAVRCALGAGRAQLFRQVLTESLLLAFLGGTAGMGLAVGIVKLFKAAGSSAIPRLDTVQTGWPVLIFCFGSAVVAAVLAALLPALRASRLDPADGIRGTRTSSAGRTERLLLGGLSVFQTALTMALLAGTALLIQTMINLARIRPGYEMQNLLTMNVTDIHMTNFFDFHGQALERISALPGVKNAAFAWGVPLTGNKWFNAVEIEGQSHEPNEQLNIPSRSVTPEYFGVLNQKILAGRNFPSTRTIPADGTVRPDMAIINEAMGERYFPGASPVGRKIRVAFGGQFRTVEIIGVVANARTDDLTRAAEPEIYYSMWQAFPFTKSLIVRTVADPRSLRNAIQHELRAIDPSVAVEHVKTMEQIRNESVAPEKFAMRLLNGFSLVGSALALIGIYGVFSLSVGLRRREMAIRMAVGAQRRDVLGLVLSEGLKLIVVGLLAGTGIALALGKMLQTFLFGVQPADPATFAIVAILFTTAALVACYVPARRAAKTDPMAALRYE